MSDLCCTFIDSPVGKLFLAGTHGALTELRFASRLDPEHPGRTWPNSGEPFREAIRQLHAYFAGELKAFDLPLDPGGTPFQQTVWNALRKIPYGTFISYKELAVRVNKPGAHRSVGAANGKNPISIIIPCHRVIGSDGQLTGYGGGLEAKRFLLELEGAIEPLDGGDCVNKNKKGHFRTFSSAPRQ